MLRQTVNVFVASRPFIVYAMICYVCFRSPHHERNQFPEDVESPAFVYCDSTQDDRMWSAHTWITFIQDL